MKLYITFSFVTLFLVTIYYSISVLMVQRVHLDEPENERCEVPDLNPFDLSVTPHRPKVHVKCRNPQVHFVETRLNYLQMKPLPFVNTSMLRCCYRPYLTTSNDLAMGHFDKECVPFVEPTRMEHEFFKVECKFGTTLVYEQYMSVVLPTKKAAPNHNTQRLNVIILIIDGVSRMSLYRNLPKTLAYVKELGAMEFEKFHRIALNSFPNMMALLTGLKSSEYGICWERDMNDLGDCPFLWNDFAQHGYVTSMIEDGGKYDTFDGECGFIAQPVDNYWKHFTRIIDHIKDHPIGVENQLYACAGDKPLFVLMFDYCNKILERTRVDRSKFFAVFHSNAISYGDDAMLHLGDDVFFEFIKKAMAMNDTLLLFMSDHGPQYKGIHRTYQGIAESNLPFLFIIAPRWFERLYPIVSKNMRRNTQRLVTMFDVHKTLHDLLYVDLSQRNENFKTRVISLFDEIPTTRSCQSAGVEPMFCACKKTVEIPINDATVFKMATRLVEHMNDLLVNQTQCAKLRLERVDRARRTVTKERTDNDEIWLQIGVNPGMGVFESVVRSGNGRPVVVGQINRVGVYANESMCDNNQTLEMYCFCI